jgi:hypothetical protein
MHTRKQSHACGGIDRKTFKTNRQADKQTDRQTDRETDTDGWSRKHMNQRDFQSDDTNSLSCMP